MRLKNWVKYHILEFASICGFVIWLALRSSPFALVIPVLWFVLYFIIWLKTTLGSLKLKSTYKFYSVHVFGYRRKGKDLSIQHYIIKRFRRKYLKIVKKMKLDTPEKIKTYFFYKPLYLSTSSFGYGCREVSLTEFEIINKITNRPVTYNEFINGDPIRAKKVEWAEGLQLILPETQLGLPNTEHNTLDKLFPWLPVFISLAGHLYDMEIIINSQEFERPWVKIRNQQDYYINALKTFPKAKGFLDKRRRYFPIIRNGLLQKVRIYQKSETAKQGLLPFDALGIVNEASKGLVLTSGQATKETYQATNGEIKDLMIFTRFEHIEYDTRHYHEVVFNRKAPVSHVMLPKRVKKIKKVKIKTKEKDPN